MIPNVRYLYCLMYVLEVDISVHSKQAFGLLKMVREVCQLLMPARSTSEERECLPVWKVLAS
jgi:hypothetical protein